MIFEKTLWTIGEIKRRKKAKEAFIKEQERELKDLLPFEAKLAQTLKIINMCYEKIPNLKFITTKADDSSEALVDQYIVTNLTDYVVKKHTDDTTKYDITQKELF